MKERKILEVHIVKGMKDGQKITFSGEGDQEPGIEPGDVIIVLDEKNHPVFKRSDIDLYMQLVGVSVMESSQSTALHLYSCDFILWLQFCNNYYFGTRNVSSL